MTDFYSGEPVGLPLQPPRDRWSHSILGTCPVQGCLTTYAHQHRVDPEGRPVGIITRRPPGPPITAESVSDVVARAPRPKRGPRTERKP